jgi:hypothetical protein
LLVAVVEEKAVKMLQLVLVVEVVAQAVQELQALEHQLFRVEEALAAQAQQELGIMSYRLQNGVVAVGKVMALPTVIIFMAVALSTVAVAAVAVAVETHGLVWMVAQAEFGEQRVAALVAQQALLEAQEQTQAHFIPLAMEVVEAVARTLLETASLVALAGSRLAVAAVVDLPETPATRVAQAETVETVA